MSCFTEEVTADKVPKIRFKILVFVTVLFINCISVCYSQKVVDFKLGFSREQIKNYFDSLIVESNCTNCKIENKLDKNGDLVQSLDLPLGEKNVLATTIGVVYSYVKSKNEDVCTRFLVFCAKENLTAYLDVIRSKCIRNEKGEWEYKTGIMQNGKDILIKYVIDDSYKNETYIKIDSYLDLK